MSYKVNRSSATAAPEVIRPVKSVRRMSQTAGRPACRHDKAPRGTLHTHNGKQGLDKCFIATDSTDWSWVHLHPEHPASAELLHL